MFTWLFGSDTQPPIFLEFRSSKTFIILTVSSAVFTDMFAYGIVVPVFPFALTSRASIDPDSVQSWVSIFLAIYGASMLVFSPFFGWLADRFSSRQIPFLIGLALLGGSTVMLCLGNSIALFAAGRVLQGASAAVVWVVGLALLVDTVGPDDVGAAMGYTGLSLSLAILVAPLLGGIVLAKSGYYSVYAMAFGLVFFDIVLRLVMIEKKTARRWLPVESSASEKTPKTDNTCDGSDLETPQDADKEDNITTVDCEMAVQKDSTSIPGTAAEAAASSTSPGLFQKILQRAPPVIFLFGSRRILCAVWACVMHSILMTSFDSILPLFVRDTFGWDSTGAGLIFLPIVLGTFFGPLVGKVSDRYGSRWLATAGFALACPFLILLRLVDHNSIGRKVLLCALLCFVGIGLTLGMTPVMAEIAYAVEAKAQRHPAGFFGKNGGFAQGYALFNMAWSAGAMTGPLLAGFVVESKGWPTATLILGCMSIFTAIPTVIWTGGSIFKQRERNRHPNAP